VERGGAIGFEEDKWLTTRGPSWIFDDGVAQVIYDSKDGKVESKYWYANVNR
jgi:hypothetical protein